jgi:hypothetical protein
MMGIHGSAGEDCGSAAVAPHLQRFYYSPSDRPMRPPIDSALVGDHSASHELRGAEVDGAPLDAACMAAARLSSPSSSGAPLSSSPHVAWHAHPRTRGTKAGGLKASHHETTPQEGSGQVLQVMASRASTAEADEAQRGGDDAEGFERARRCGGGCGRGR